MIFPGLSLSARALQGMVALHVSQSPQLRACKPNEAQYPTHAREGSSFDSALPQCAGRLRLLTPTPGYVGSLGYRGNTPAPLAAAAAAPATSA